MFITSFLPRTRCCQDLGQS